MVEGSAVVNPQRGMKVTKRARMSVLLALVMVVALSLGAPSVPAQGPVYSVWVVRNSVFKDVPAGAFMPDRAFVPGSTSPMNNQVFFQLPVNVGVIKGGKDVILYDTGWKQQDYLKMTNSVNWAPLPGASSSMRLRISAAALFVKVTANIFPGGTPVSSKRATR